MKPGTPSHFPHFPRYFKISAILGSLNPSILHPGCARSREGSRMDAGAGEEPTVVWGGRRPCAVTPREGRPRPRRARAYGIRLPLWGWVSPGRQGWGLVGMAARRGQDWTRGSRHGHPPPPSFASTRCSGLRRLLRPFNPGVLGEKLGFPGWSDNITLPLDF